MKYGQYGQPLRGRRLRQDAFARQRLDARDDPLWYRVRERERERERPKNLHPRFVHSDYMYARVQRVGFFYAPVGCGAAAYTCTVVMHKSFDSRVR